MLQGLAWFCLGKERVLLAETHSVRSHVTFLKQYNCLKHLEWRFVPVDLLTSVRYES